MNRKDIIVSHAVDHTKLRSSTGPIEERRERSEILLQGGAGVDWKADHRWLGWLRGIRWYREPTLMTGDQTAVKRTTAEST